MPQIRTDTEPLLQVRDLQTHFDLDGRTVKAVDGVSFDIHRGRCLCIVGESGSGKSITARSILRLVERPGRIVGGSIVWNGGDHPVDLTALDPRSATMRTVRGNDIGMVFQEPMASLSPMYTVEQHLIEAIRTHDRPVSKADARARGLELLDRVGISRPETRMSSYPFQLSGGLCQRVMIAIALSADPALLIADEPTTALDVTTQARILRLLAGLQRERGLGMMFITHDLGVVAELADDVAVMRRGHVVESGTVDQIFHDPQHPYTRQLLDALPQRSPVPLRTTATTERASSEPLVKISGLSKRYTVHSTRLFSRKATEHNQVLSDVALELQRGEVLGLVGESGSGKTTLGRCLVGAYPPDDGSIRYYGRQGTPIEVTELDKMQRRQFQLEMRMVFQDPYSSLNPRKTIQQIIGDPLTVHGLANGSELEDRVAEMLTLVGLPRRYLRRYPHAFSGGERQRISIARALVVDPVCVVADEAVSALDMSVRAQVLELLDELKSRLDLTYLFISHDLSVIRSICDRVAVMSKGDIVELGSAEQIFDDPQHDYTKELLAAAPVPDPRQRKIIHSRKDQPA
ncbi:peptide/nickel transport system ATP-binding protein [Microlunatus soli]|uniref:Peptide/nickel transport system ATP-binding protein n=2 Tax=Microlunatus soli TaxID=630515 RepID=A0A1H1QJN8_9ACTN|nr:peptide/nickel transport system ATP-binding protein [Microlunatus soli]